MSSPWNTFHDTFIKLNIGGRSGRIWVLMFMVPVVFASMIHDSYKNFLLDSWFTKTFHLLLTSQWHCLVLFCSVYFVFKLLFRPNSVSSFVLSTVLSFFVTALSTRLLWKQADYQPRMRDLYRGVRGHTPPRKMFENWTLGNAISSIYWIERS